MTLASSTVVLHLSGEIGIHLSDEIGIHLSDEIGIMPLTLFNRKDSKRKLGQKILLLTNGV